MASGSARSKQDINKILSSYSITGNIHETSRQVGMPYGTCYDIIKRYSNQDEYKRFQEIAKQKFVDDTTKLIDKMLDKLDKELDKQDSIPINQLTTGIGTLYDKKALSTGNSTTNTAVTITMSDELKELSK